MFVSYSLLFFGDVLRITFLVMVMHNLVDGKVLSAYRALGNSIFFVVLLIRVGHEIFGKVPDKVAFLAGKLPIRVTLPCVVSYLRNIQ